jgi:hypothetical protein
MPELMRWRASTRIAVILAVLVAATWDMVFKPG